MSEHMPLAELIGGSVSMEFVCRTPNDKFAEAESTRVRLVEIAASYGLEVVQSYRAVLTFAGPVASAALFLADLRDALGVAGLASLRDLALPAPPPELATPAPPEESDA